MNINQQQVEEIHASPYRLCLAITGGGSGIITELLRYGGGSQTLVEAVVPYDPAAFRDFVGCELEKYCSAQAAELLAAAAYVRLERLRPDIAREHRIGVGVTASLAKSGERAGRRHKLFVGYFTSSGLKPTRELTLAPNHREIQEEAAQIFILQDLYTNVTKGFANE